jgi:hypothetical protein
LLRTPADGSALAVLHPCGVSDKGASQARAAEAFERCIDVAAGFMRFFTVFRLKKRMNPAYRVSS